MKRTAIILAALMCMASRHPDRMVRADLVLNASFNRGDATDRSWNAKDGALTNGAVVTAGNRWATLDGTNDYVTFGDDADFTRSEGFSVSVWIKPDSMTNFRIASKAQTILTAEWVLSTNASAEYFFSVYSAGSTVNFLTSRTAAFSGDASNWVHICAVYDGSGTAGGVLIYRNGALTADTELSGGSWTSISDTSSAVMAGVRFLNDAGLVGYADGSMDDVRIYNRAISAAEVAALFSSGRE